MKKLVLIVTFLVSSNLFAQNQLYKVTLLRAKPGELLNLIDRIKEDINDYKKFTA